MHSLKKDVIFNISNLSRLEELKSNQIILITALGIIKGELSEYEYLADDKKPDLDNSNFLDFVVDDTVKNYRKEVGLPNNEPLDGNDGVIVLKNVQIISGGNVGLNIGRLAVFFDQIIGISFGNF